ncbi:putative ribonuclease H-like domain-containing protein [Tanacetum coccineum]
MLSVVSIKTGLESVEARLLVFKKNESLYEEDIKLLKCEIYLRDLDIAELKRKLELATKEKDECKTGLRYNAVPPPYTGNFMPPKPDLVYPSLNDFVDVNEPVSEFVVEKPTVETNKPKTARKENEAPIIEDWVSESEEEDVYKRPFNKILAANSSNFTKKVNTVKGTRVNTARPKSVISTVMGNKGNDVKASACRKHALSFMRPFGCLVTILNTIDHLGKFDGKADEGFFVGYSTNSKAFKVFNNRTRIVEENMHVQFSENTSNNARSGPNWLFDIDALTKSMNYKPVVAGNQSNGSADLPFSFSSKDSPDDGFKPSGEERKDGTKWVFRNKKDERGIVIKNKARLAAQGYTQEEGINYDEFFAPVARIKVIRLFLAYASFKDCVVYQMDIKSAFLYCKIEEEVYVCQPPGFEDPDFPDRVYKVEKALYGLHQTPKAWYETLSTYLLDDGFQRGKIDKTLFIRMDKGDILLVQVYVDDIIFGSTKKSLCNAFEKLMHEKFQMSSMGELTFFLRLQVKQKKNGIFISQDKYVTEILKKFSFIDVKTASTPIETNKPLLKDEDGEEVDVHMYRSMIGSLMYLTSSRPYIMFVVCACARYQVNLKVSHLYAVKRIFSLDRKSTTGGCQFLGCRLISWQCKKQTVVANSTTEAEYVAASSCCGQVLWIQNQLLDYGYNFMHTKIFIDNNSTICIVKNPVFHSKTKHIEIRHHFIRDSNEKKLIQMVKIHTDKNVADLLTKAFDVSRFQYLIASIGMLNL